jgi:hypothetical protein
MNENLRPSRLIGNVREILKPHVHDGIFLSPEELSEMLKHLMTIQALAEETEEELEIVGRRLAVLPQPAARRCGNVVNLADARRPKRIQFVQPNGGGDAA